MSTDQPPGLQASQVHVLLDPDLTRSIQIDMPTAMGRWVGLPVYTSGPVRFRFELSEEGEATATSVSEILDAANDSLADYLNGGGERSSCLPGAFRDGFARGWDERRKQARDHLASIESSMRSEARARLDDYADPGSIQLEAFKDGVTTMIRAFEAALVPIGASPQGEQAEERTP